MTTASWTKAKAECKFFPGLWAWMNGCSKCIFVICIQNKPYRSPGFMPSLQCNTQHQKSVNTNTCYNAYWPKRKILHSKYTYQYVIRIKVPKLTKDIMYIEILIDSLRKSIFGYEYLIPTFPNRCLEIETEIISQ